MRFFFSVLQPPFRSSNPPLIHCLSLEDPQRGSSPPRRVEAATPWGTLALKVVPSGPSRAASGLKVLKGCLGTLLRLRVSKQLNVLKSPTRPAGLQYH